MALSFLYFLLQWPGILILGAITYFLFFYKSRTTKLLDEFPKPYNFPVLGIIPYFLKTKRYEILPAMGEWKRKHGPILHLASPFGSSLVINDSATAEKVLTSQINITKGHDYDYIRPWLGDALLMSTGQKWGHRRKMLTPAFHFKILEDFLHVFNQKSFKMTEIMRKECSSGNTFDICSYVTRCALDIICETAMGKTYNALDYPDNPYIKAITRFGTLAQDRAFRPWLKYDFLWHLSQNYKEQMETLKILHGFTNDVIADRKKDFLKNPSKRFTQDRNDEENIYFQTKKRLAFLDLLLEVQKDKGESELSDQDIREETDTFMFEGHDTTSANVSFTLYALGCYPEIQEKAHAELEEIFGSDTERHATSEDLSKMKYLESVIKESLRVYPSVPFIQRKLVSDIVLEDGRVLPKDVTIAIFIYEIHKDPKVFPNPEQFNPERFINATHDPFAFVPFSAGPRNCIGQKFAMMEEKVMISTVLRKFRIVAMEKPENLKLRSEMILRPEDGLPVKFVLRQ